MSRRVTTPYHSARKSGMTDEKLSDLLGLDCEDVDQWIDNEVHSLPDAVAVLKALSKAVIILNKKAEE